MTQADSVHSTPPLNTSSRRNFLAQATAAAAGGAALAMALPLPGSAGDSDSRLLDLEKQALEAHAAAMTYDAEIMRCHKAWIDEYERLGEEVTAGRSKLTGKERWEIVGQMPEAIEQTRLAGLQDPHFARMDKQVREMWKTPARTADGRRAKVEVLLTCIMGRDWQDSEDPNYDIDMARQLLIEFVGGEPGKQLAAQFAAGVDPCS